MTDEVSNALTLIQEVLLPRIVSATVPLVRVDPNNPRIQLDRSGVLIRIADEYFILTASHGLEQLLTQGKMLYVAVPNGELSAVPLGQSIFHWTEPESRDVAIIQLSAAEAGFITQARTPISMAETSMHSLREGEFYITAGYPSHSQWFIPSKFAIESRIYPFLGSSYKGVLEPMGDWKSDARLHLAVRFDTTARCVKPCDRYEDWEDVSILGFRNIQGISGCGIWQVHSESNRVTLAAVQHRLNTAEKYAVGTRVSYAIQRLLAACPHLVPAANLTYHPTGG